MFRSRREDQNAIFFVQYRFFLPKVVPFMRKCGKTW